VVGHVRQACEDFTEIRIRVEAATTAAFEDGVEDGAVLADLGITDEEPVLLAQGGGANGVFDQIVIDLHPAVAQVRANLAEGTGVRPPLRTATSRPGRRAVGAGKKRSQNEAKTEAEPGRLTGGMASPNDCI